MLTNKSQTTTLSAGNLHGFRVLVTGGAGSLGRSLSAALHRLGATVMIVDMRPLPTDGLFPSIQGKTFHQITDSFWNARQKVEEFLSQAVHDKRFVFHFAGIAEAGLCSKQPDLAFEANVKLTSDVLESCRRIGGTSFVFPSTGLVYGDRSDHPTSEDDPVDPGSIYAATKLASEVLIRAYSEHFGLGVVIARLSNIYGPGLTENSVIGRILSQVSRRKQIQVMDETPVRDFIFSGDVIEAFIKLVAHVPKTGSITVNVSTGIGTSVGEVVRITSSLFPVSRMAPDNPPDRGGRTSYLVMTNEKLKRITGWAPQVGILDGLQRSIQEDF